MATSLIGLGSNVGHRQESLERALARLQDHAQVTAVTCSQIHATAAIGGPADQGQFLNAAARVETSLTPSELLAVLQQIESEMGRQRRTRWAERTLDLDLLLYDDVVMSERGLELPHSRMAYRPFVLRPAAEVAGRMRHPTIGWTIQQLLDHITDHQNYVSIAGPIGSGKTQLASAVHEAATQRSDLELQVLSEPLDEPLLERFYADPTGRAWETELEFLRQRADLVAANSWLGEQDAAGGGRAAWRISDFWFPQSLAFAEVWLDGQAMTKFRQRYESASATVVTPKLLVVLRQSTDLLVEAIAGRGRDFEQDLNPQQLDALNQSLQNLVSQGGHGPVLNLDATAADENVTEVIAAIEAMSDL